MAKSLNYMQNAAEMVSRCDRQVSSKRAENTKFNTVKQEHKNWLKKRSWAIARTRLDGSHEVIFNFISDKYYAIAFQNQMMGGWCDNYYVNRNLELIDMDACSG